MATKKAVAQTKRLMAFHKHGPRDGKHYDVIYRRDANPCGEIRWFGKFSKGGAWAFLPSTRRAFDAATLHEIADLVESIGSAVLAAREPKASP